MDKFSGSPRALPWSARVSLYLLFSLNSGSVEESGLLLSTSCPPSPTSILKVWVIMWTKACMSQDSVFLQMTHELTSWDNVWYFIAQSSWTWSSGVCARLSLQSPSERSVELADELYSSSSDFCSTDLSCCDKTNLSCCRRSDETRFKTSFALNSSRLAPQTVLL